MTKIFLMLLFASTGGFALYTAWLKRRLDIALRILEGERTRQRSLSASQGRIAEQWFPLMEGYPYDSANFRFLGTPVDGVQFEEDRIVFIEFKSGRAELSAPQKRLKTLVQSGKVYWEEFHISESEGRSRRAR